MYQNVSDIASEVCLSLVAEAHTRGLRPVHLCPMRSLDVPFQPSATQQKGSSNSCWCVCACFILFCACTLVCARKTDIKLHGMSMYHQANLVTWAPEELRELWSLCHQKLRRMAQNAFANCPRTWPSTIVMSIQCWMFWGEPRRIWWGTLSQHDSPIWHAQTAQNISTCFFHLLSFRFMRSGLWWTHVPLAHLPWSTWNRSKLIKGILKLMLLQSRFRSTITVGHSRSQLQIWHQNRQAGLLLGWIEFRRWGVKP